MNFLDFVLDIFIVYFNLDFLTSWFYPVLVLAFLATVPRIIYSLVTWR